MSECYSKFQILLNVYFVIFSRREEKVCKSQIELYFFYPVFSKVDVLMHVIHCIVNLGALNGETLKTIL